MNKFYLVVNPRGGARKGRAILDAVRPVFAQAGATLEVQETHYAGHARELAHALDFSGYAGFCVIGGDGSMHEVVNGMLSREDKRKLPIGPIAGGTGNSFLRDLDCLDPLEAARRIVQNTPRKCDIARVQAAGQTLYGFNLVGWGLPTDITVLANKLRWCGGQRYNLAALIEVMKYRQRLATICIDGHTIAGDFGFILGCNTVYTGNAMKMAPLARIDDGLIDLLIVRKAGRLKLLSLFSKIFNGSHVGDPVVVYHQAKSFSVTPLQDHALNIDGEILGSTPIEVTMLPGEIEVLV